MDKYAKTMKNVGVERVLVVGAPKSWEGKSSVKAGGKDTALEFHGEEAGKAAWAVVKSPKVAIGEDWKIEF